MARTMFVQCSMLCAVGMMEFGRVEAASTMAVEDIPTLDGFTFLAVGCISALLLVFVIALCGGCTPMEVGSDSHAASGPSKAQPRFDSMVTDANTRVLTSGTTMADDPYRPQDQGLPYSLHPQVATAPTFTGYSAVENTGGGGGGYQGTPGGYAGNPGGYGDSTTQGYQGSSIPGANRPVVQSEPPPPNYYQATGGSANRPAQQQSYGW